ncbi:unnamed protein product [Caenorhabditis angaria]|uniref:Serpentine Receptor, class H n=1 Tax=Caenorhabditis angaria TaxID=860376 RepID=A0A9P1IV33_9PELO|nr:unnamed protein product [Caenorhabditis angaria]
MIMVHFTSTVLDLYLSLLTCPFVFLPYPAGYPIGLLKYLGVPTSIQVYFGVSFIGVVLTSLVNLFESRYNKLSTNTEDSFRRKICRYSIAAVLYIWAFTFILPAYFNIPDSNLAIQVLQKELHCVEGEKFNNPYFFCLTLYPEIAIFAILLTIFLLVPQMLFHLIRSFKVINKNKHTSSRRTYLLRFKFMLALCIQVFVPMIFLVVPASFVVFSLFTRYFNQGVTNLSLIFFATHGGISSIVTLIVHKPYREFTIETFYRVKLFRIARDKFKYSP